MEKRAKKEKISKKNRLSELPEEILLRILSFLPAKDAMATTILSSAWRDLWLSLPCLNLGKTLFHHQLNTKRSATQQGTTTKRLKREFQEKKQKLFIDFVDETLNKLSKDYTDERMGYVCNVHSVHLYMPNCKMTPETSARLDWWINHAITNIQLEELNLYSNFARVKFYKLPGKVLVASKLLLKRLCLGRVHLNQEILECLATSCPLIEYLCFEGCLLHDKPVGELMVSGFSKLDELVLHYNLYMHKLVIDAPNLGSLDLKGIISDYVRFKGAPGISLRSLRINGATFSGSSRFVALVSKVEHLVLEQCHVSSNIVIFSNDLKSLCLLKSELKGVIDAPRLTSFESDYSENAPSFAFRYSAMEKVTVYLPENKTAANLIQYLSKLKFNHCEKLELHASKVSPEDLIIAPHLQKGFHSSLLPYGVKHLTLKIGYVLGYWKSFCVHSLIDSLLWICLQPKTISIFLQKHRSEVDQELKVLKFKYFKKGEKGAKRCRECETQLMLCWHHYLKEVIVENHKGARGNAENYQKSRNARAKVDHKIKAFFEDAREEEKIIVKIIS